MGTWNDFLWPLIVMTNDTMYTLPVVALANLLGEHVQDTELMMAASGVDGVTRYAGVRSAAKALPRRHLDGCY
jgi:hypothetical protein